MNARQRPKHSPAYDVSATEKRLFVTKLRKPCTTMKTKPKIHARQQITTRSRWHRVSGPYEE